MPNDWRSRAIKADDAPPSDWRSRAIPVTENPDDQSLTEKIVRGVPELVTGSPIGENMWGGGLITKGAAATAAGLASVTTDRDKKWSEIYDQMMEQDQKRKDAENKRSPGVAATKSVLGSIANPVPVSGKMAESIGSSVPKFLSKYIGAAGEMGVNAGGNYLDTLERTRNADEAAKTGKETLAWDAGLRAAPAVVGALAKGTARVMTGLKGETIDAYRTRRPQVNAANMDDLLESGQATAKDAYADQIAKRQELARFTKDQEDQIKSGARKASGEAFDPLIQSDKEINMSPVKGNLTQEINSAKFGNAIRQSPGTTALQKERDFLEQTGLKNMRPEEVKRYVMQLDRSLEPAYDKMKMGIPLDEGEKALIGHRKFLDSKLKEIPEYDAAMAPVRDRMRVLSDASPHIGDVDQTYRTLERVDSPTMTGAKKSLEGMFPWQSEARNIPEEASKINAMNKDLRGVNENNMEPFLNRMTRAKQSAKDTEAFSGLAKRAKDMPESAVSVRDMEQYLTDLNTKQAFEKPYVKGSRNVNLGALSLGGAAKIAAHKMESAGTIGAAVGAVLGAGADMVGPQTVKKVIDLVDSPAGHKFAAIYRKAAERGPQAIAITHAILRQNDPEYRALLKEDQ